MEIDDGGSGSIGQLIYHQIWYVMLFKDLLRIWIDDDFPFFVHDDGNS